MICQKCKLPTDEDVLTDGVCGPCSGEVAYGTPMFDHEDSPVVSILPNYSSGRGLFSVQYRYPSSVAGPGSQGYKDFESVGKVEQFVRDVSSEGGEIVRVSEVRELLPDEAGGPVETMFVGDWTRERIERAASLKASWPDKDSVYVPQLDATKQAVVDKVRQAAKNKTFAEQYGKAYPSLQETTIIATGIIEKLERDNLRRVKQLGVDRDRVLQFLTRGSRYVTKDIPEDVEILEISDCRERRQFVFTLRHDSFPVYPEGNVIEMIRPVWEKRDRELVGDLVNLVERAVQIHAECFHESVAEEYLERAEVVMDKVHGRTS